VAASGLDQGAPVGEWEGSVMTMDEMKRRYRTLQEQIRRPEAVRAEALRHGDPIPRRVEGDLAEARISAEELRMWGNRELTRQIREYQEAGK
jgi:hypothetical protein